MAPGHPVSWREFPAQDTQNTALSWNSSTSADRCYKASALITIPRWKKLISEHSSLKILILEAVICRLDRIFRHVDLTVSHSLSSGQGKVNCSLAGLVVQCTRVHPRTRAASKLHAARCTTIQQTSCHVAVLKISALALTSVLFYFESILIPVTVRSKLH